jgi:hypothetical protein
MQDAVTICKLFFKCCELSFFFFFLGSIYTDFLANLQAACGKKIEEENQCVWL